jgi:hypothetical protein
MKPETRNPETPNKPAAWFTAAIASGLQALYAINPDGCPGADVFPATIQVWASDLWHSPRRFWHEGEDKPCILVAFATLRGTCQRWPTPAKFWEVLPSRKAPEGKLLGEHESARRRDALDCERRWRNDLGLPPIDHVLVAFR